MPSTPLRSLSAAGCSAATAGNGGVAADAPVGVLLVVVDQDGCAETLAAAFEPLDCTLVRVGSAHEAVVALLDNEFAVVVLDIDMPLVNGIELVHIIKQ